MGSRFTWCLGALTHCGVECSDARLTARRVDSSRCVLEMHLPHRRHRRERDRDAKGENEGKKSQTRSHRQNLLLKLEIDAIDGSRIIPNQLFAFRARSHT